MHYDPCADAPYVTAEDGAVVIEAADGRIFTVTPKVAMMLSEHLVRSAARARGQTRLAHPRLFRD